MNIPKVQHTEPSMYSTVMVFMRCGNRSGKMSQLLLTRVDLDITVYFEFYPDNIQYPVNFNYLGLSQEYPKNKSG